ncbi:hypothetical protein G9A89_021709 [Geosiphon pyriformis]|nr:hypothetical protein G9A89_021709 [Geosiphon pyriformis]
MFHLFAAFCDDHLLFRISPTTFHGETARPLAVVKSQSCGTQSASSGITLTPSVMDIFCVITLITLSDHAGVMTPYFQHTLAHNTNSELQDGEWFQGIENHVINNQLFIAQHDFIIGIQGYVDKTGTDAYNRMSVEPFAFTVTLFMNVVQNISKYWRVLALLPEFLYQKQTQKHTFGASVRNYHSALKAAFEEFIFLEKNPPTVRLRIRNEV